MKGSFRRDQPPLSRADLPFGLLALSALASPAFILGQGGDWHTAILGFCAVLGLPGLAVEAMTGLARAAVWIGTGGRG